MYLYKMFQEPQALLQEYLSICILEYGMKRRFISDSNIF
jgi:hypothetical protein